MPDLITHTAAAYFIMRPGKFARFRVAFYVGTILPDILSRPFYILKPELYRYTIAIHTPVFIVLFCFLFAEFFNREIRKDVRNFLLLGAALHFFLDLFQRHLLTGYLWFFPFSYKSFEIGLYWPETPLYFIPLWVGIIFVIEGMRYFRQRRGFEKLPGSRSL
ncbi:MAG: hypothetical protein GXO75_06730 [Calditrichaeota bacterium]|nr:hypothetical protein [Calditrichota bacterium]